MGSKKTGIFILVLIIICALSFFFLWDTKKKSTVSETGNIYHSKVPLEHSGKEVLPIANVLSNDNNALPLAKFWHGTLLSIDNIKLYAPEDGKLHLFVKNKDRIKQGNIIGEIECTKNSKSLEKKKVLFNEEISMKHADIDIALDDMSNIEEEIDKIKDKLQDAYYEYGDSERDYNNGLIEKKFMIEKKEEWNRLKMHLEDAEKMLNTKFRTIDECKERIRELKSMLKKKAENLVIISPFDGVVSKIFVESNMFVNKTEPLIEFKPVNLLSITVSEQIPFYLDGKKVKVSLEDKESTYCTGSLKIERFIAADKTGEKKTFLKVILDQERNQAQYDLLCESGKRVNLLFLQ